MGIRVHRQSLLGSITSLVTDHEAVEEGTGNIPVVVPCLAGKGAVHCAPNPSPASGRWEANSLLPAAEERPGMRGIVSEKAKKGRPTGRPYAMPRAQHSRA